MSLIPPDAFQFCGPTNLAESPLIDAQRSINLYLTSGIPNSNTRLGLIGRPGTSRFASLGSGTYGHSLWAGYGKLFASTGGHVYELSNAGAVITDYGGGITDTVAIPTPMVPLDIAGNSQLLICDPGGPKIYNIAGGTLTQVFQGVSLVYLDGFYVAIAAAGSLNFSNNPNQLNVSNNGDGTTWNALNYVIDNSAADQILQQAVLNNLLYVFGQKTIRVWYDAGTNVFPLQRVNGGVINLGCVAANSVVGAYNCLMWLGGDDHGYAQVYMMQGLNPIRVSNLCIEQIIAQYSNLIAYSKAFMYQENGHTFYVLSLCTAANYVGTYQLVYDLTMGLWHERVYRNGAPVPGSLASVPQFGGSFPYLFVTNDDSPNVYQMALHWNSDDGTAIDYTRVAPHFNNGLQKYAYNSLNLYGTFGSATPALDYSNNGGQSFLGYSAPLTTGTDQSIPGSAVYYKFQQLGASRDRVFKMTVSSNSDPIAIAAAYLDADIT
jgi:hypothetical protein